MRQSLRIGELDGAWSRVRFLHGCLPPFSVTNAIAGASPIHAEGVRRTRGFVQVGLRPAMPPKRPPKGRMALFPSQSGPAR